jgi:hypothetical protein
MLAVLLRCTLVDLVVALDDENSIQVQSFAILSLHDKIKPPTLYECFLSSKSECYSKSHNFLKRR